MRIPSATSLATVSPTRQSSALGDRDAWDVPYWFTDAAMATMSLLLLIEDAHWGATLWGNFRHEQDVCHWAKANASERLFASVLVGHADGGDHRSRSLDRAVLPRRDRVRRLGGDEA